MTIGWSVVAAVVAVVTGFVTDSTALVAFGFVVTTRVMLTVVVVLQFRGETRSWYDPPRERLAPKLIAVGSFVLATCVTIESIRDLTIDNDAGKSIVGTVVAGASLIVMSALSVVKRGTAERLQSSTLRADSRETLRCAWLSAALLVGLVLNVAFSWTRADPVAAIIIAAFAIREGVDAFSGVDREEDDHNGLTSWRA